MVASQARRERRRAREFENEVESVKGGRKKTKFGRKEKRSITRHMRRGERGSNDEEEVEQAEELEQEEEERDIDSDEETASTANNRKAYESLLALLKYDHPDSKKERSQREVKDQVEDVEDEDEDDDEIAGLKEGEDEVVDSADSDDEADEINVDGEDEDDLSDEDTEDPFNAHLNDEEGIETKITSYDKVISQGGKRKKLANKVVINNEFSVLEHLPDIDLQPLSTQNWNVSRYHLKNRLLSSFEELKLSEIDKIVCNSMFQYQDINLQYFENEELESSYQDLYVLHCLNHIFKTRDKIIKNNSKKASIMEDIASGKLKPSDEPDFRDQGYTRPKVLIMLPTRQFAYELVMKIAKLAKMDSMDNTKKFKSQFYDDFKFDATSKKSKQFRSFFKGNTNDYFCIGLKFTRKSIKLYSSFDSSDIIIASPLALNMILKKRPNVKKGPSSDFLSSIELTILDKSHGLLMQNWDLVVENLKAINAAPKNFNSDVDFSRVRMWSINDQGRYLTQFLNFTRISTPELNNVVNSKSLNVSGSLTVKPIVQESNSALSAVNKKLSLQGYINNDTKLKQIFQRFPVDSVLNEPDARFKFFINVVLSQIMNKSSYKEGILIYVPSYMDYLRLTNYFKQNSKVEVLNIDEYSSQAKLTKCRQLFERESERFKIMLYTERLHFYKNYELKGVKNLIFYGIPTDPQFYQDCIQFLIKSKLKSDLVQNGILESDKDELFDLNLAMVRLIYSKFDLIKLEKLVGLSKANLLCNGGNEVFEFR